MFTFHCPLRWSDLDAQGHVNNAAIVDHLQEARVAFFHEGPASELLEAGVVVVGHQVEYLASVEYSDQPLLIELGLVSVGGARFEIVYSLAQHGRAVARARTALCPFDFEENRPVRLEPGVRDFLRRHILDAPTLRPLEAPPLGERGTLIDLRVRWADLDSYGHVNNAKAYDYLQQGRIEATARWDPTMVRADAAGAEFYWLVARQDVDYVAQLPHRLEPYAVRTAPVRIGSTSMVLASEIVDPATGVVFNRGRTVLVCADTSFRPVELPEPTRRALAAHLVS